MMSHDDVTMVALSDGRFTVEESGKIWRCATVTRSGSVKMIEPRRADFLHAGNRYLKVRIGRGRNVAAHRMVWLALRGSIPSGMEINHKDFNRSNNCIDNLELLTHKENVIHAVGVARRGGVHSKSNLTDADVIDIRRRVLAGEAPLLVARRYSMSRSAVYHIVKRRVWTHLASQEQTS